VTLLAPDPARAGVPFAAALAAHGHRPALVTPEGVVSYAELDRRVEAVASRLGTTARLVLLEAATTVGTLVAYLGALRGRHPVLLAAPGAAAAALADAYDPDVVVPASGPLEERRPGSRHALHPDLALLLSTSGSTGSAKLVRLSAANLQANAAAITEYLRLTDRDRAVTTLPLQYCYGLSVVHSHLLVGASVVLTDLSVADPCFWRLFREARATSFAGVPYTFELLDQVGFASMHLPTLRYVTQAGGRLAPEKVQAYAELARRGGWELVVMYGQTEATARMAYLPPALAAARPDAIGVPIPGGRFRLDPVDGLDDRHATAGDGGDGDVGELVYEGPNVMLGYAHGPEDLALGATVTELRTGDLARRGADGLYEVVGRRSRFVKLFGLRVDLDEVERLATATAGGPALCSGDDDHLAVAVEAPAGPAGVADAVAARTGLPATRVRVAVVDELPRLANGKADYPAVRALTATAPSTTGGRTSDARAVFADVLGLHPDDVGDDDTFVSLGGDSLSYVEVSVQLEAALGTLPPHWHLVPVRLFAADRTPRRRFVRRLETGVALRAVAIVLIVGTHADLWTLAGGAHALLGVAGYNFARFQRQARRLLPGIARIAVPCVAWIGIVAATTGDWGWPHALLLNAHLGQDGARWGYWYVETLVHLLLAVAVLLAVPGVRALERRAPFGVALAVLAAGLALRFDVIGLPLEDHRVSRPQEVLWLFALGWAGAVAHTTGRRVLLGAVAVAAVPGFFPGDDREVVVLAALLLLLWVPTVPVPAPLARVGATLAGASLAIYLTHWQVYPPILRAHGPLPATVAALAVGAAAWWLVDRIVRRGRRFRTKWCTTGS